MSATTLKVGFIGLGTMGTHMAANLQKAGHALVVHDIHRQAAGTHVENGATWAATAREVAAQCDVVFASLPAPPDVEAVVFGTDGVLEGAHPGMAFFDLSTNSQAMAKRMHAAFAEKGCTSFDSPVSGGPEGARTGKLAIWVGGDKAAFDRYLPVLQGFGDAPAYIGGIGTATVAKLVHNLSGYAIQTVIAEAFSMGVKAGMDPLELWAAIRRGALGRKRTFDRIQDQYLQNKYDPPAFALRLGLKDVSLAVSLGRELGVPMRLSNLVMEEMTEALNRGWGQRDSRSPMILQNERAGVSFSVDPAAIKAVLAKDPA
ncbi:NAD(P)-dependent oxidoreductase [Paeniroseomonas aquatica]|uniref:NAD(P)-dependent oxidoreductase n=1 Tax=Paeniroseomonas aquatica TaxID=373043 RepID=A0ABT8A0N6_9PROT|nr:NAD(P)-dependent oxidoreductase [Paeniroseomonas aquatica]MDN3563285.1 NAD(P)-dependent oxidoreductase [Paeniroseomonas aquatica]